LREVLQNSKRDEKRGSILTVIDDANWFEGKLIEDGLQNNLRSFVGHNEIISERLENYLRVRHLSRDQDQDQDQVVLYYMESKCAPFFKKAYEMVKNLSYIILNMLALLTGGKIIFDPTHCNPN